MISFLRGTIQEKNSQGVIMDVNGVGYQVFMSTSCLSKMPPESEHASVFAYLHVREDLMQLFGFCHKSEKELFEMLISVSGIGPKVALAVLSAFSVETFQIAIQNNDIEMITTIPGIGKKGAQRLVLELKEKLTWKEPASAKSGNLAKSSRSVYSEARDALMSLGYSVAEATDSLEAFPYGSDEVSAEDLIKHGLKNLAGG